MIAIVIHCEGVPNYATHYRLLAAAVERAWRETTDKPMRYFGSYTNVLNGVSFYLASRPSTLDITDPRATPWSDAASVARAGIALACPESEAGCMQKLNERAAGLPRHAATLSRLNQARQAALATRSRGVRAWWLPAAGLAASCALLFAVVAWYPSAHNPVATVHPATTDAEIAGDDGIEFYQDLEFYAWLDAQDEESGG